MNQKKYDLIVIGSGVLGTFHAYFALEQGKKVLMIEKDLRPQEATVRNFGQVVPSGFAVGRWNTYGRFSMEVYKRIQERFDIGIRNNGSCYVASDVQEAALLEEMRQRFRDTDYESVLWTKEQVLERYPQMKTDYVHSGLFFPQEVSAEPEKMIHLLHQYMQQTWPEQLEIKYSCPALHALVANDQVEVITAGGHTATSEHAFVCTGRDFKILFPEHFMNSGLVVSKINMMATYAQQQVLLPGNVLTGLSIRRYESFKSCDAYRLLNPEDVAQDTRDWGIHILFKQRTDGSIIIGDSHEYAPAEIQDNLSIYYNDMRINECILREAKRIIDLPDWRMAQYWTGFYAQHNELDLFKQTIDGRIHIVTGIGGKGMTAGAGLAHEHISELW